MKINDFGTHKTADAKQSVVSVSAKITFDAHII